MWDGIFSTLINFWSFSVKVLMFIGVLLITLTNCFSQKISQDTLIAHCGLTIVDSVYGEPGKDYYPEQVLVFIDQEKFDLKTILGKYWGKSRDIEFPPNNDLLKDLNITNPAYSYIKYLNLIIVNTLPNQTVIDAVKELRKNPYVKRAQPRYYEIIY